MTCQKAREISIVAFLENNNIHPEYKRGSHYWYLSPLRQEDTASFKVNADLNLFYDHGTGNGGDIIDLGCQLLECDVKELLERLDSVSFSFQPQDRIKSYIHIQQSVTPERQSPIQINHVQQLGKNPALRDYLESRGIPVQIARPFCKEVYYQISDKRYFAVGFENRSGGYELRSPYFKGSSSPKDITLVQNGNRSVCVLEGFMDFLSLLTLQHKHHPIKSDFLVLNSVSLVDRSLELVNAYHDVFLYLDRDKAGKQALEKYQSAGLNIVDVSRTYLGFKDLNDYLMDQKTRQQELKQQQTIRQSKGFHL
jgi:DNA primase